jgi:hypothetical protein
MASTLTKTRGRKRIPQPEPLERPAREKADRPWHEYRCQRQWQLLKPGWAGCLAADELSFIQEHLKADDRLSLAWGFRPGQKLRSEAAIQRIALHGDSDRRSTNVRLARTRKAQAAA